MTTGLLVGLTAVIALVGLWARRRVKDIERLDECTEDFFSAAGALINDERAPEDLLSLIQLLAWLLGRRWSPWHLYAHFRSGRVRRTARHPSTLDELVDGLPDELRRQFEKMAVAFILGVTYRSTLIGGRLRRFAFYNVFKENTRRFRGADDAKVAMFDMAKSRGALGTAG